MRARRHGVREILVYEEIVDERFHRSIKPGIVLPDGVVLLPIASHEAARVETNEAGYRGRISHRPLGQFVSDQTVVATNHANFGKRL